MSPDFETLVVMKLSEHVALGISPEIQKHGGCYLILALDYAQTAWGKPAGDVRVTLCGLN